MVGLVVGPAGVAVFELVSAAIFRTRVDGIVVMVDVAVDCVVSGAGGTGLSRGLAVMVSA